MTAEPITDEELDALRNAFTHAPQGRTMSLIARIDQERERGDQAERKLADLETRRCTCRYGSDHTPGDDCLVHGANRLTEEWGREGWSWVDDLCAAIGPETTVFTFKDELAKLHTTEARATALQDRLDELLPPLTPDFENLMAQLDSEVERLAAYNNSETGKMSTPAASRDRTLEIIHMARHLIRYANDGESGNRVMAARATAAEEEVGRLRAALTDCIDTMAEVLNAEEGLRTVELEDDAYDSFRAAIVHLDRDFDEYWELTRKPRPESHRERLAALAHPDTQEPN